MFSVTGWESGASSLQPLKQKKSLPVSLGPAQHTEILPLTISMADFTSVRTVSSERQEGNDHVQLVPGLAEPDWVSERSAQLRAQ